MKFIPDEEINLYKDDLLGTQTYVETLIDIIKTSDIPFTIGLLGGWGTGKSSIVNTLKEEFDKDTNSKIKVFIYDAWKYSKDDFRRTFLLEVRKFANLDINEERELFYEDKTKEIKYKVKIDKWFLGVFLTLTLFSTFGLYLLGVFKNWADFFKGVGGISILSGIITFIMQFLKNVFIYHKVTITTPKLFAPEQFEERFKKTVNEYFDKNKKLEKFVVVIDNIDRCHKESALETLLTVKNFLAVQKVIFIIPVDEDGLKVYLSLSNQDANEFLRKLFNSTIKIRKFSPDDLFDFCKKLNERYGLNLSDEVLSIVAQEFAKNPRRIIQFFNNLQSEILLSEKMEKMGLVEEGVITNNVPMLAKLLIIREEWPDLYKKISDDPDFLKRITQYVKEERFERRGNNTYELKEENITLTEEQRRFLIRTSPFLTDKLEPFLVNRDVFKDIPDEINELILSQDWDTIKEKYLNKNAISFNRLIDFISQKLDKDVIKRHLFSTSGFNLLALIFKIANDEKYGAELENLYAKPAFEKIIAVCNMKSMQRLIFEFNSEELIKFAKWLYDKEEGEEGGVVDNIIEAIRGVSGSKIEKKQFNMIKTFINIFQDYPEKLKEIKNAFSQLLIERPQLVDEFKEILKQVSVLEVLVTYDLIKQLIDSLKRDFKQDNTKEKVELLNIACENGYLSGRKLDTLYIEKIIQFANVNNWEPMDFWFSTLKIPFKKISNDISSELVKKIYDLLSNRYQWLYSQYTTGQISEINIRVYNSFLYLCFLMYISTQQYRNNVIQWMGNFFVRDENQEIYFYINNLYLEIVDKLEDYNWPFSKQVINRFVNTGWPQKKEFANTLNKMLLKTTSEKGLNKQQINTILDRYLNIAKSQQSEQSIEAKKWIKAVIGNKVIKDRLRVKISNVNNPQELLTLLEVVLDLKDEDLERETITKILLQTPCENIKNAVEVLFDKGIDIEKIQGAVKGRINQLDIEKNVQDRNCLFQIIDLKKIINEELSAIITDKLKPLLASNNKENELFALKSLDNLEKLPPSRRDLLKVLLREINTDEWQNEEKALLDKIIKRIE